jgi:hypothetical protein
MQQQIWEENVRKGSGRSGGGRKKRLRNTVLGKVKQAFMWQFCMVKRLNSN